MSAPIQGFYTEAEANVAVRTYVSDKGLFIYRPEMQEFGTNKEHYAGRVLAELILEGLDIYERVVQPYHFQLEALEGDIHDIVNENEELLAIRVKNPKFICEGLKEALNLPQGGRTNDQLVLVREADNEFSNFLVELAYRGVLDTGPRDTIG